MINDNGEKPTIHAEPVEAVEEMTNLSQIPDPSRRRLALVLDLTTPIKNKNRM
jgi:hypothetical protein